MLDKMNSIEKQNPFNDGIKDGVEGSRLNVGDHSNKNGNNILRKIGIALGLAAAMEGAAAGCTPVPGESAMPTKEPVQTEPETESPSQTEVKETETAVITFSPTGEVTVSPKPSPTPEFTAKPTEKPTDNPTVEPTETVDPNETEQNPPPTEAPTATVTPEATATPLSEYNLRLLEIYGPELEIKDCKTELKLFCAKLLNTLDINNTYPGEMFIKSGKLTRDQVFDYGKEGVTTSFELIKLKDGSPAFAIFADADVVDYFNKAFANWEVDVPNFKQILVNNEMVVINQEKVFPKNGMDSYYDMNGLFILNANRADIRRLGKSETIFMIQKHLGVEHLGIKGLTLGGEYAINTNNGYLKQDLYEIWCKYLYIITGKDIYKKYAKSAADHKNDFVDKTQPQEEIVQKVIDGNLIPVDKPWSEILAVVNGK